MWKLTDTTHSSRWPEVERWLERLRTEGPRYNFTTLSKAGLQAAIRAALEPLSTSALQAVAAIPGRPYPKVGMVPAFTTVTAPIEWLALLLGRGSEVVVISNDIRPGLSNWFLGHAEELPVRRVTEWEHLGDCDYVVVFGDEALQQRIRPFMKRGAELHAHGSSWSAAWVTGTEAPDPDPTLPSDLQDVWGRIASDCALHDSRGCLSPSVVFTPLPLEEAVEQLARGMAAAEAHWPRGTVFPVEAATTNGRETLARAAGAVRVGDAWSVHGVPAQFAAHTGLPRSPLVVHVEDIAEAVAVARQWAEVFLAVGTEHGETASLWLEAGARRISPLGRMQRPPLDRLNRDGRWIERTLLKA